MRFAQAFLTRGLPMVRGRVSTQAARSLTICRSLAPLRTNVLGGAEISPRLFSSDPPSTLIEILAKESLDEESVNEDLQSDLADFKKSIEEDWEIVENGATTNLFMKGKKVQISFNCQDTIMGEDDFDYDRLMEKEKQKQSEEAGQEEDDEEEEEEEDRPEAVRFCVTVSKEGKTLVINCVADEGEPKIEGVYTTTTEPAQIHANRGNPTDKNEYQGPEYLELDEGLQDGFIQYLEQECGVDNNMASFVTAYSDYREQMQYTQFLKDVQPIIS